MAKISKDYEGWNTESHLETFDLWNNKSDWEFDFAYGCFAEQKYLRKIMQGAPNLRLLDVGCATGTTYRFLTRMDGLKKINYLGVDLSQPAIDRARKLYPNGDFRKKEHERLLEFAGGTHDVVFSRDTILHQTKPLEFLQELMEVAGRVLIVRLRTRDVGETVYEVGESCQMHYDKFWMPYIVLNLDELISYIKSDSRVAKITINRSYEVLGGKNFRFLPKELYLTSAGGAETSVMIEFSETETGSEAELVFENQLEGHAYLRQNRFRRYAYSLWSAFTGRRRF